MGSSANEVRIPVRLEVLQDSISSLQSILNNLKPESGAWKEISQLIRSMEKDATNLQSMMSKPFGNQSQFNAAEKSVGRIDDAMAKVAITMQRITFKDLKLTPDQESVFRAIQQEFKDIENEINVFKANIKANLQGSDLWESVLKVDPAAVTQNFDTIVKTVAVKVNKLNKEAIKAEETMQQMQEAAKKADFTKSLLGDGAKGLFDSKSDVFKQFFQNTAKGLSFKTGQKSQFYEWMKSNLTLSDAQVKELEGLTAKQLQEKLQSMDLTEVFNNAKNKSTTATTNYNAKKNELEEAKTVLNALGIEAEKVDQKTAGMGKRIQENTERFNSWSQSLVNGARNSKELQAANARMKDSLTQVSNALSNSNAEFIKAQRTIANFNAIKMAVVNFMGFRQTLNLVKQAIKGAMSHIKELDTVMNRISIVTDMSTEDLWQQVDSYSKMAQTYGTSIKGAYEVSQIYYQQGLKTNEVLTLTNETLKLSKVSGLDYAATTDYMTTALRGFKMEMEDASRVVDVYTALAAHTAVSSEELAVAMSKTASSMESVGSTFEETSAMIATMVAVTRESATNIGSALKSIAARYGEMKSNPSTLIDADGEQLAFNKVDAALQSVGISMKTTDGQFREFTDVILELSDKWSTLDSVQQRYIATQFAGNRQQSRFLALVSNADLLRQNLDVAENSEDTGTLQALKSLDSIESKLEQVKVAYQQFYTTVGGEVIWKGALDAARGFVDYLNGLPKLFGKIPVSAIAVVANAIGLIKQLASSAIGWIAEQWKAKTDEAAAKLSANVAAETQKTLSEQTDNYGKVGEEHGKAYAEGVIRGAAAVQDVSAKVTNALATQSTTNAATAAGVVQTQTGQATKAEDTNATEKAVDPSNIEGFKTQFINNLNNSKINLSKVNASTQDSISTLIDGIASRSEEVRAAFQQLGRDGAEGYLIGLLGEQGATYDVASGIAREALNGIQTTQQSNSPAKATEALGHDFVDGYLLALASQLNAAFENGQHLADSALEGINISLDQASFDEVKAKLLAELETLNPDSAQFAHGNEITGNFFQRTSAKKSFRNEYNQKKQALENFGYGQYQQGNYKDEWLGNIFGQIHQGRQQYGDQLLAKEFFRDGYLSSNQTGEREALKQLQVGSTFDANLAKIGITPTDALYAQFPQLQNIYQSTGAYREQALIKGQGLVSPIIQEHRNMSDENIAQVVRALGGLPPQSQAITAEAYKYARAQEQNKYQQDLANGTVTQTRGIILNKDSGYTYPETKKTIQESNSNVSSDQNVGKGTENIPPDNSELEQKKNLVQELITLLEKLKSVAGTSSAVVNEATNTATPTAVPSAEEQLAAKKHELEELQAYGKENIESGAFNTADIESYNQYVADLEAEISNLETQINGVPPLTVASDLSTEQENTQQLTESVKEVGAAGKESASELKSGFEEAGPAPLIKQENELQETLQEVTEKAKESAEAITEQKEAASESKAGDDDSSSENEGPSLQEQLDAAEEELANLTEHFTVNEDIGEAIPEDASFGDALDIKEYKQEIEKLKSDIEDLKTKIGQVNETPLAVNGAPDIRQQIDDIINKLVQLGAMTEQEAAGIRLSLNNATPEQLNNNLQMLQQRLQDVGQQGQQTGDQVANGMNRAADSANRAAASTHQMSSGMKSGLSAAGMGITTLSSMIGGLVDDTDGLGSSIGAIGTILGGVMKIFSGGPMGIIMGITTVLTGVISFIQNSSLDKQIERATKKFEELDNQAKQVKADFNALDKGLEKYKELETKRYESAEAAEEYQAQVDDLTTKFPELLLGFDEAGNAILDTKHQEEVLAKARQASAQATEDAIEAEQKQAQLKLQQSVEKAYSAIGKNDAYTAPNGISFYDAQTQAGINISTRIAKEVSQTSTSDGFLDEIIGEFDNDYFTNLDNNDVAKILLKYADAGKSIREHGLGENEDILNSPFLSLLLTVGDNASYDEKGNLNVDQEQLLSSLSSKKDKTEPELALQTWLLSFQQKYTQIQDAAYEHIQNEIDKMAKEPKEDGSQWTDIDTFNSIQSRMQEALVARDYNLANEYYTYLQELSKNSLLLQIFASDQINTLTNEIGPALQNVLKSNTTNTSVNKKSISTKLLYGDYVSEDVRSATPLFGLLQSSLGTQYDQELQNGSQLTEEQFLNSQREFINSINTFYKSLASRTINGEKAQDELIRMLNDTDHYSAEDIIQVLQEAGITITDGFDTWLKEQYTDQKANIINSIQAKVKSGSEATTILDDYAKAVDTAFNNTMTTIDQQFFDMTTSNIETLEKLGLNAKASDFGGQSIKLYNSILDIEQEYGTNISNSLMDIILKYGLSTKESIDKIRQEAGILGIEDENFDNVLSKLAQSTVTNISLSMQSLTDNLLSNWNDKSKNLKKLTTGIDFTEVDSILSEAESFGMTLDYSDFKSNGNQMVLTEEKATEYWDKFFSYNREQAKQYRTIFENAQEELSGSKDRNLADITEGDWKTAVEAWNRSGRDSKEYDAFDALEDLLGEELTNYLDDNGFLKTDAESIAALKQRIDEKIKADGKAIEDYEWYLNSIEKAMQQERSWNLGDYSSLQSDLNAIHDGEQNYIDYATRLQELAAGAKYSDAELELPDIKNAVTKIQGAYGNLISDIIDKGIDNVNLNDYQGIMSGDKRVLQQYIENGQAKELILAYYSRAGKSVEELDSLLASYVSKTTDKYGNAISELMSYSGGALTKSTAKLLDINVYGLVDAPASILVARAQTLLETLHAQLNSASYTLEEYNASAKSILEKTLFDKGGKALTAFDFAQGDIDADALEELANSFGLELTDLVDVVTGEVQGKLDGALKYDPSTGLYEIQGTWDQFLNSIETTCGVVIDRTSKAYADAYNDYIEGRISKQSEGKDIQSAAFDQLKGLTETKPGDYVNLSYLSQLLGPEQLEAILKDQGQTIEDGLLTLSDNADIPAIISAITDQALKSKKLLPEQMAELQDTVSDMLKSMTDTINNGIKGTLSHQDAQKLTSWAQQYSPDLKLNFTETVDGLKLSTDSAKALYHVMNDIDEIQGRIVFDELKESLIESKDELRSVQTSLNYTQDLTRELYGAEMIDAGVTDNVKKNRGKVAFFEEMNGNVDLYDRHRIKRTDLGEGWYSTLETATLESGNFESKVPWVMNITPIPPDVDDVEDMLSQEELYEYVQKLIDRADLDPNAELEVNMNAILAADKVENGGEGLIVNLRMAEELTDSMIEEESQRAEILHEISDVYEGIKDGDTYDPTKINQYKEELSLVQQIRNERSTTEDDSFKFMENSIPSGQNNPLNYFENWATAYKKMRESIKGGKGKKGYMAYEDFYNIITEMGEIAKLSGEAVHLGKATVEDAQTAADLITKAAGALEITSDGKLKVNLKNIGVDFSTGAKQMNEDVNAGIDTLADSQIAMLDSMINLLEVVVAMESLGDIDIDHDNTIDLDEVFEVKYDNTGAPEAIEGFKEAYTTWRTNFISYVQEKDKDGKLLHEDLYNALGSIQLDGTSLLDMLVKWDENKFKEAGVETAQQFTNLLSSLYTASLSDNFDLNNIEESVRKVLLESGVDDISIDIGSKTVSISGGEITTINYDDEAAVKAAEKVFDDFIDAHPGLFEDNFKDKTIQEKVTQMQKLLKENTLDIEQEKEVRYGLGLLTGDIQISAKKDSEGYYTGTYKGKSFKHKNKAQIETIIKQAMDVETKGLDFDFKTNNNGKVTVKGYKEIGGTTITLEQDEDGHNVYVYNDREFKTLDEAIAAAVADGFADSDLAGKEYTKDGQTFVVKYNSDLGFTYTLNLATGELEYKGKKFKDYPSLVSWVKNIEPLLNKKEWKSDENNTDNDLEVFINGTARIERNLKTGEVTYTDGDTKFPTAAAFAEWMRIKKLAEEQGSVITEDDSENKALTFSYMGQSVHLTIHSDGSMDYDVQFGADNKNNFVAHSEADLKAGLVLAAALEGGTLSQEDALKGSGTIEFNMDGQNFKVHVGANGALELDEEDKSKLSGDVKTKVEEGLSAANSQLEVDATVSGVKTTAAEGMTPNVDDVKTAIEGADLGDVSVEIKTLTAKTADGLNPDTSAVKSAIEGDDDYSTIDASISTINAKVDNNPTIDATAVQSGIENAITDANITLNTLAVQLGDDFTVEVESIAEAIRKALQDALDNKPIIPTVEPTSPTPTGGNGDGGSNIASIFSGAITAIKEKISSLSIDATVTKIQEKLSSLNVDSSTTTIQKKLTALNADAPTRTIQNKLTALNVNTAATSIQSKLNLISGATAASNIQTAINNISLDTLTTAIGKVNTAINNLNNSSISPTITPTITPTISGTNAQANAKITVSAATQAKGNVALARGTKTLMGELGPELVVSNGRYFVVGQNGAEFVDLANDAIVFNHKQTARLIGSGGISSRGTPFTNETNAISYAKGNISGPAQANPTLRITGTSPLGVDHGINSFNWAAFKISIPTSTSTTTTSYAGIAKDVAQAKGTGPALASAQAALTALKQLRAMWKSLKDTNMKDLASLGGSGGGGGGGGSGSKNKDNVNKAFIKELERWYNWLQEIAQLEEKINMEEAQRNKLASDNYKNGKAYYQSQRRSLDDLQKELAVTEDLLLSQKAYFNSRREFLNSEKNPFSSLYTIDENGQLKYKNGKFTQLSKLSGTDAYGDPYKTAKQQYDYIVDTLGISADFLKYTSSGEEIWKSDNKNDDGTWKDEAYQSAVEAFWDKMEADKEEMQSLHDSIDEYQSKLLKLQQDENEILQDMQDNQMDVETAIYDALVETKQRAIDKLSDLKDAYSDASSKMISGLSDAVNKERDKQQKNEEDAELLRLRRRLALLQRSGGSASEISSLQAEIRSKSQDAYYNEQQRQIDLLQDAADKQIERLDTQIDIQTRTLEYQQQNGLLWNEVYAQMKKSPTEIANFLKKNTEDFWGKSTLAKSETADDWLFKASQWVEFRNDLAKTGKARSDDSVAQVIQTLATKNSSTKSADDFVKSLGVVYGDTYKSLTKSVKESIKKAFETEYTASGDYIKAVNNAIGKANLLTETQMSGKKYVAAKGKSGAWELKESTSKNATTGKDALKTVKQNNAWIDKQAEYKAKYGNSWNTLSSAQKTTIANAVKTQATASKNDKTKADKAVTKALAAPGTLYTETERNKKQFTVETKKGVSSIKQVKVGNKGATTYDEAYNTMQANNAWKKYETSLKTKYGATYTNLSSDRKETIKKQYLAAYDKEKTTSKKATAGADAALKGQGAFLGTASQQAQSGGAKDTYGWTYTRNATTGKYEAKKIAKKDAGTKTLTNYAKAQKAAQRRNDWEAFIAPYSATWNTLLTGDQITSLKSIYDNAWNGAKSKPAEAASKAVKNSKIFKDNFVDKVWAVKQDTKTKTWSVVKARKSTKTPTTKHKATQVAKSNNNLYKKYQSDLAAANKKKTKAPAAPKYNTTYQYDIGGMVESTGMALLHAKEAVLTSQQTDILRNDILGNNKGSLVNLLLDFKKAYNNIGNPGAQMEPAIIIQNASVNMNVEKIANDYDARRAGEQALTEMLKIARKTGAASTLRR